MPIIYTKYKKIRLRPLDPSIFLHGAFFLFKGKIGTHYKWNGENYHGIVNAIFCNILVNSKNVSVNGWDNCPPKE